MMKELIPFVFALFMVAMLIMVMIYLTHHDF